MEINPKCKFVSSTKLFIYFLFISITLYFQSTLLLEDFAETHELWV